MTQGKAVMRGGPRNVGFQFWGGVVVALHEHSLKTGGSGRGKPRLCICH